MKTNKFEIRNQGEDTAELLIYGIVGDYWDELDAADVVKAIRSIDAKNIVVKIHSEGGSVFAGLAIYNALMDHSARITVRIDALAASIASVVAMAGEVVEMPGNAFMMIHNPWVMVVGDEQEVAKAADMLGKIKQSLMSVYNLKTGIENEQLSDMMDDETWLMAKEAVELGFADKIVGTAPVENRAFFNQLKNFRKVPQQIKEIMNAPANTSPEDKHQKKEVPMTITLESIRADYPDIAKALYDEGHAAGVTEGAKGELDRVRAVQAQSMPGHEELVAELAFDGKTTGPEAAVRILAAEKALRVQARKDLEADGIEPVNHTEPGDGGNPADEKNMSVDRIVASRAMAMAREKGISYDAASKQVLRDDKELAGKYREMYAAA